MITDTSGGRSDFVADSPASTPGAVEFVGASRLGSGGSGLIADDFVALDHRGDAHASGTVVGPAVDAHHFSHRTNEYFGAMGDLRGQRQRDVEFTSGIQFIF